MKRSGPRSWAPRMIVLALLLAGSGCQKPELVLADGSAGDWAQWQGSHVLVNYWAEWCAPCRKEIPELNRLNAEDNDIVVLGVNFDSLQGEALEEVIGRMDIEFPVLVGDPRERWDLPAPTVLPSTLVVGPEGELQDVLVGPQTYESLMAAVEAGTGV